MATETSKEKSGGMAYEVILKPATTDTVQRPPSPPKERPVSQEIIEKKLKDAEERRQSMEMTKLEPVNKRKARALEVQQNKEIQERSFSEETEKKLQEKLTTMEENKNAQIATLQSRLRDHAKRVAEVRTLSDNYSAELKEQIEKKLQEKDEKRQAQLKLIQERIKEHEKHIGEVLESSKKFSKITEAKLIQKMESTLKNRQDQLEQLVTKLQEHEKHAEEVRKNKMEKSISGEECS